MKEPKVQVKNVRFHEGREGTGVNADFFINGVKCIHVLDDGNGGCLSIDILAYGSKDPEKIKALVAELEAYVDSLPEKPFEFNGTLLKDDNGNVRMIKNTLEDHLNDHLYEYEHQQVQKKIEKRMQTSILWGVPNNGSYGYIDFKRPLSTLPLEALQTKLNILVMEKCKKGVVILNTNLTTLGLVV